MNLVDKFEEADRKAQKFKLYEAKLAEEREKLRLAKETQIKLSKTSSTNHKLSFKKKESFTTSVKSK